MFFVCGFVFFVHMRLPIDVPSYFFVSLSILGFCVYIYMYIYSCPSGRHKPQSFIETQTLRFCNPDTKNFKK